MTSKNAAKAQKTYVAVQYCMFMLLQPEIAQLFGILLPFIAHFDE